MVCTVLLNALFFTSLIISARIIGAGKPNKIVRPLIKNVFFSNRPKYGSVKKFKNHLYHGLDQFDPSIPLVIL